MEREEWSRHPQEFQQARQGRSEWQANAYAR
jgi:hypothetical protein